MPRGGRAGGRGRGGGSGRGGGGRSDRGPGPGRTGGPGGRGGGPGQPDTSGEFGAGMGETEGAAAPVGSTIDPVTGMPQGMATLNQQFATARKAAMAELEKKDEEEEILGLGTTARQAREAIGKLGMVGAMIGGLMEINAQMSMRQESRRMALGAVGDAYMPGEAGRPSGRPAERGGDGPQMAATTTPTTAAAPPKEDAPVLPPAGGPTIPTSPRRPTPPWWLLPTAERPRTV